jgi:hypothetical protein
MKPGDIMPDFTFINHSQYKNRNGLPAKQTQKYLLFYLPAHPENKKGCPFTEQP